MGKLTNAFVAVLLFGGIFPGWMACMKRPAPVVAEKFDSLRPLRVAVLPSVFLPDKKDRVIHKSRDYTKYFYHPITIDSPILMEFDKVVRENLRKQTIEVVDPQLVKKAVLQMNPKRGLSWKKLGQKLKVDTLVFITLTRWKAVPSSSQSTHRILRVRAEVALYNVINEELLWRDQNYPGHYDYTAMNKNRVRTEVVAKAVHSIFQSFPASL